MADEEDTASPQGSGSTTYNFNLNFQAPHALSNLYSNATANQHYQPLSMQQGGVQYHGTVPHGDLHHPYQHQDTAVQAAFAQRTAPGGSQPQPGQHSIQGAPHPAPNQQRTAPGTAHYAASSRPPYSPTFQPHGRYSDIFKDGKVAILVSSTQQVQQDITDQGRTYDIQDYNQAGEFSQPTVPIQSQQAHVKLPNGVTGTFSMGTFPGQPQQRSAEKVIQLKRRFLVYQIEINARHFNSDGSNFVKLPKRHEPRILKDNGQPVTSPATGRVTKDISALPSKYQANHANEVDLPTDVLAQNTRMAALQGQLLKWTDYVDRLPPAMVKAQVDKKLRLNKHNGATADKTKEDYTVKDAHHILENKYGVRVQRFNMDHGLLSPTERKPGVGLPPTQCINTIAGLRIAQAKQNHTYPLAIMTGHTTGESQYCAQDEKSAVYFVLPNPSPALTERMLHTSDALIFLDSLALCEGHHNKPQRKAREDVLKAGQLHEEFGLWQDCGAQEPTLARIRSALLNATSESECRRIIEGDAVLILQICDAPGVVRDGQEWDLACYGVGTSAWAQMGDICQVVWESKYGLQGWRTQLGLASDWWDDVQAAGDGAARNGGNNNYGHVQQYQIDAQPGIAHEEAFVHADGSLDEQRNGYTSGSLSEQHNGYISGSPSEQHNDYISGSLSEQHNAHRPTSHPSHHDSPHPISNPPASHASAPPDQLLLHHEHEYLDPRASPSTIHLHHALSHFLDDNTPDEAADTNARDGHASPSHKRLRVDYAGAAGGGGEVLVVDGVGGDGW